MDSEKRHRIIRAVIGLVVPAAIAVGLVVVAPTGAYLWLKAIHVAAAVTWISGMLGLIYLLSWHAGVTDGITTKLLSQLEFRVLQGIVNPAMVLAWGIGLWLAWDAGWYGSGWFHVKLGLVLALSALHGWVIGAMRAMARGRSERSGMMYRDIAVAGAAVAIAVIVLAVVKPM
jgi:putative membrane protein